MVRYKFFLLVGFLLFALLMEASESLLNETALHIDARSMAMGNLACSMEPYERRQLECTYLLPFQLSELSIRKIRFRQEIVGMSCAFGWYQSGNVDWMENNLSLQLAKNLSEKCRLGLELDETFQMDALDNRAHALFVQLELLYRCTEEFCVGALLVNPNAALLHNGRNTQSLNSSGSLCGKWKASPTCSLYAECCAWLNQKPSFHVGMEYELGKTFFLRIGCSTQPLIPSWGIGGKLRHFNYAWAGNFHPLLGMSNGFTLSYLW